jgi:5-methylcytosine-specific restriction endonuclease McrA
VSHVVVLNASYEPIGVVTVRRAVVHVIHERAVIVEAVPGETWRNASGREFPVPLVVRLTKMVKIPFMYSELTFSRQAMFERDEYRCAYCGRRCSHDKATVDHVLPQAQGGLWTYRNCVTSCRECNGRKGNRTPERAGMPLLYQPRALYQRERLLIAIAATGADMVALGLAVA